MHQIAPVLRIALLSLFLSIPLMAGVFDEATQSKPDALFGIDIQTELQTAMYTRGNQHYPHRLNLQLAPIIRKNWGKTLHFFGAPRLDYNLREAKLIPGELYFDLYLKWIDFRIGNQRVIWGKTDGKNPLSTVTPVNIFRRTSDLHDNYISNFMIKASIPIQKWLIELYSIPQHQLSEVKETGLPRGISVGDLAYTNRDDKGLRASTTFSGWDLGLYFYDGFSTQPGVKSINGSTENIAFVPYAMTMVGADLATTYDDIGFRAEIALKQSSGYQNAPHNARPEIDASIGFEQGMDSNITLLFQLQHKIIQDHERLSTTDIVLRMNQVTHGQTIPSQTSFLYHLRWSFFYDALIVENLLNFNTATRENLLRLAATYQANDRMSWRLGIDVLSGSINTLAWILREDLTFGYLVCTMDL